VGLYTVFLWVVVTSAKKKKKFPRDTYLGKELRITCHQSLMPGEEIWKACHQLLIG